jgi:NAD(P)-dependent dehydrogenase (short-subunit alcohol dehydrogenase family)
MSRRVLLTGATGTVGSAIRSDLLKTSDFTVVTAGRRPPFAPGRQQRHVRIDLADPGATDDAARQLAAVPFAAAVLAAGIDSRQGLADMEPAVFNRVMQVNCLSQLQLIRHLAAPGEAARGSFTVVAVSSDVVGHAQPASAVYAASKAALEEALRHAAHDIVLRLLLIRLPYIGVEMAETGETGITARSASPVPTLAREAATATLRFLNRPGNERCAEVWP